MPELPEVHTITTDLKKHLENTKIVDVVIKDAYLTGPNNEIFVKTVLNKKIVSISRVAKNIKLTLEDNNSIIIHLAMTGRVFIRTTEFRNDLWERVVFVIEKNGKHVHMRFCDMRMFGKVALLNTAEVEELHNKYGPEPIAETTTAEIFLAALKSKRTTLKNALLDQHVVSGLGNIYATDALFLAKLHPEKKTGDLTLEEAAYLLAAARQVLNEGIEHRGSTLDDEMYVDVFGKPGTHQNHFKIYDKKTCPACGTKVAYKKLNGRGTYFCPKCQKE